MNLETGDKYLHLKIKAAAFGTAWWLFVAPDATRWMWPRLTTGAMPNSLITLLGLCWLWLLLGFVAALGALSSDFRDRKYLQTGALWFVLGVFSLPVLAIILSSF